MKDFEQKSFLINHIYLENFTRSVRILDALNIPENRINLINNLPWDKTAEIQFYKLHERHS